MTQMPLHKSWEQDLDSEPIRINLDIDTFISTFLQTSKVVINDELDISSSPNEAFLKTTQWASTKWLYRIPTWYLYFRRIEFKQNPEINGRWEWAGIYFGEKL